MPRRVSSPPQLPLDLGAGSGNPSGTMNTLNTAAAIVIVCALFVGCEEVHEPPLTEAQANREVTQASVRHVLANAQSDLEATGRVSEDTLTSAWLELTAGDLEYMESDQIRQLMSLVEEGRDRNPTIWRSRYQQAHDAINRAD